MENNLKNDEYKKEYIRLSKICEDLEPKFKELTAGLVEQAAELYSQRAELKSIIDETGTIKIHPEHSDLQKALPVAQEYRQTANCYAVVINKLNQIIGKNTDSGEEDDYSEYDD